MSFIQGHQILGLYDGSDFFYHISDGLSSVRVLIGATGSAVAHFATNEFGIPEPPTGPRADLDFMTYQGSLGVRNDSSGLYYARQRYYDPALGKWISADPIGFEGGLNLYAGMENNPTTYVDPSGLKVPPRPIPLPPTTVGQAAAKTTFGQFVRGALARATPALADGPLPVGDALAVLSIGKFILDSLPISGSETCPKIQPSPTQPTPTATGSPEPQDVLYRQGTSWESRTRLERKSIEAEINGFGYGVSTSMVPVGDCSRSTKRQLWQAGFIVVPTPTRRDPTHHTVIFQKPLSQEQTRAFNQAFGRSGR